MGSGSQQPGAFLGGKESSKEPRSLIPWVIAGVVVLVAIGALLLVGHRGPRANPGGAGLAPADAYAVSLPISDVHMSQANSVAGGQVTYIDGQIANHGDKTISGITVQVAFHDFTNLIAQKETMPLNLIRVHEPYIDTQPVSASPIKPGETREFRLIFDHVANEWNQNYPEIRVIEVTGK
jgi:hypothetical protein